MYSRINALKASTNPAIKVMLVLGGWTESGDDSYSRLVSDARSRSIFASHAAGFLKAHGFDGLHLDWQYPVCWQADCSKGPASDRTNYPLLAQVQYIQYSLRGCEVDLIEPIDQQKQSPSPRPRPSPSPSPSQSNNSLSNETTTT